MLTEGCSDWLLARKGARALQALNPEQRVSIINKMADLLIEKEAEILAANARDLERSRNAG